MVADQHEVSYFVKLARACHKLNVMMAEPSIALMADKVADVADFVSIGTNDLTQYTLAADRTRSGFIAKRSGSPASGGAACHQMICDAGNAKGP